MSGLKNRGKLEAFRVMVPPAATVLEFGLQDLIGRVK
jgi:hypothetical protein